MEEFDLHSGDELIDDEEINEEEINNDSESDEPALSDEENEGTQPSRASPITRAEFDQCCKKLQQTGSSLKEIKRMLGFFSAACHVADIEITTTKKSKKGGPQQQKEEKKKVRKFRPIASGELFNDLMNFCFSDLLSCLQDLAFKGAKSTLSSSSSSESSAEVSTIRSLPSWGKIDPLIRSFLLDATHFLKGLEGQSSPMVKFILANVGSAAALLAASDKDPQTGQAAKALSPVRKFLKALLLFWLADDKEVQDEILVFMHRMGRLSDALLELIIRSAYETFLSAANTPFPQSHLITGLVALLQVNPRITYRVAFLLIRDLAGPLRDAHAKHTEENVIQVISWKFLNRLRIWGRLLIEAKESDAKELVYPFLEVCQGAALLANNTRTWPARFHFVRLVLEVCEAHRSYVPVAPLLLEALSSADLTKSPKPGKPSPVELPKLLKVNVTTTRSRLYHDAVVTTACDLLTQFFALHAASVAFTETALPVMNALKRLAKSVASSRHRRQLQALATQLTRNSDFIMRHRASAEVAPADLKAVRGIEQALIAQGPTHPNAPPLLRFWAQRAQELARQHAAMMAAVKEGEQVVEMGKESLEDASSKKEKKKKEKERVKAETDALLESKEKEKGKEKGKGKKKEPIRGVEGDEDELKPFNLTFDDEEEQEEEEAPSQPQPSKRKEKEQGGRGKEDEDEEDEEDLDDDEVPGGLPRASPDDDDEDNDEEEEEGGMQVEGDEDEDDENDEDKTPSEAQYAKSANAALLRQAQEERARKKNAEMQQRVLEKILAQQPAAGKAKGKAAPSASPGAAKKAAPHPPPPASSSSFPSRKHGRGGKEGPKAKQAEKQNKRPRSEQAQGKKKRN